jgi:RNA polymerase sigma-70 factor, ECF subfamily
VLTCPTPPLLGGVVGFIRWDTRLFGMSAMSSKRAPEGNPPVTTLGDLLYSDRSQPVVAEHDWLRLVEATAAGDQEALRALYERSHRLVFTLAMRICSNPQIAEELTVDVFHDVWRRAGEYQAKDGTVIGWIMMQARSRAIDRLRFEQRKKRVDPGTADHGAEPPAQPDAALADEQRRGSVTGALTALTPDERETIETAFFSELTYAETAERLDQPLGTVKTRVRSALAKLRKALESDGGKP